MRIAFLTQYYPPEIGAPQARLSELAQAFVKRGHHVDVLTAQPNYPTGKIFDGYAGLSGIFKREVIDGAHVVRTAIWPSKSSRMMPRLASYFSFVGSSAAVGIAALPRPDFLFVESPPLFLGISALWLSRIKRTKLIFNVSDLWPDGAVRLGFVREGSVTHKTAAMLEAICYRAAWLVTGQSKSILENVQRRFPGIDAFHLSNGCDTNKYGPDKRTDTARATIDPDGGGNRVFLYAGLHGLPQGLEQILEVAERLRNDNRVRFVFVGDGPDKDRLRGIAQSRGLTNVRWLDPVPSSQVPALLAAADGVLVTLKMDLPGAVPSKIYEAMASEKPIVLVANGEAADIVRGYEAGLTVSPGDIDGFEQAVRKVLDDPAFAARMASRAHAVARAKFDRKDIATRFIDHLERSLL